jgi:hypothetical protein
MRPPTPEDLEFLRSVRGRFQDTKFNRVRDNILFFVLGILFPMLFLAFFFIFQPLRSLFAVGAFGLFALTANLWRDRGLEYEFTGEEIIERRAGGIRKRMQISEIVNVDTNIFEPIFTLKTQNLKMTIQILPSLNEVIQKKAAESMAKQSEVERKRYEEVNQQLARRLKWVNIIVSLVIVLGGFGVFVLFVWLKSKQLKH